MIWARPGRVVAEVGGARCCQPRRGTSRRDGLGAWLSSSSLGCRGRLDGVGAYAGDMYSGESSAGITTVVATSVPRGRWLPSAAWADHCRQRPSTPRHHAPVGPRVGRAVVVVRFKKRVQPLLDFGIDDPAAGCSAESGSVLSMWPCVISAHSSATACL